MRYELQKPNKNLKKSHGGEIPWLISQENGSQSISKQGAVTMVRE